jgi:hypothetical protein
MVIIACFALVIELNVTFCRYPDELSYAMTLLVDLVGLPFLMWLWLYRKVRINGKPTIYSIGLVMLTAYMIVMIGLLVVTVYAIASWLLSAS